MSQKINFSSGWIVGVYALAGVAAIAAWQTHESVAVTAPTTSEFALAKADLGEASPEHVERESGSPGGTATAEGRTSSSIDELVAQAAASLARSDVNGVGLLLDSPASSDPGVRERQQKIPLGVGSSLGGLRPFPSDNPWNQRIDDAPVDRMSESILRAIGNGRGLHPDFASGEWDGAKIGIPYVVVSSLQPRVPVEFVAYGDESDPGPYPVPPNPPIEGAPNIEADRHILVLDRDNWKLYELAHAFPTVDGWRADCGAIWDLTSNAGRPVGWTSADAAGLPIFPGLVRYDEVEAGEIRHALRFTLAKTRRAYVPPASHWASSSSSPLLPPMGMRVRLKKDFDVTKFPREVQVILRCLQTYGMILADNGSDWFVTGAPDDRWDDDALHLLHQVKGSDFEVLRMDGLVSD